MILNEDLCPKDLCSDNLRFAELIMLFFKSCKFIFQIFDLRDSYYDFLKEKVLLISIIITTRTNSKVVPKFKFVPKTPIPIEFPTK